MTGINVHKSMFDRRDRHPSHQKLSAIEAIVTFTKIFTLLQYVLEYSSNPIKNLLLTKLCSKRATIENSLIS